MKSKLNILLVLSLLLTSSSTLAQSSFLPSRIFSIGWDINTPLNNTEFIGNTSATGVSIQGRYFLSEHVSVGGELAWTSLYEYAPRETHTFENGAVTTDLYKYNYLLPISVNAHYYLMPDSKITPYLGLGVGAMCSQQDFYFNVYKLSFVKWGYLVKPELGALVKFGESNVGAMLGVRYNYGTNREPRLNYDNMQTLGFNLGIVFSH
jgi:opacity protein-like surface antigen